MIRHFKKGVKGLTEDRMGTKIGLILGHIFKTDKTAPLSLATPN